MTRLATGILAHVDPVKTTLSEALLYESGAIRKLGRVDSKDAFLDNNSELTYNEGKDFRGVLLTLSDNSGIIRISRQNQSDR